ncbi:MAG: hypothetical protein J6K48_08295 [Lachnospiraceae bacterium]|nr:hypothetical protein [Lachnospiraceae bacterium]
MVTIAEIEVFLKQERQEYKVQMAKDVAIQGFSSLDNYRSGTMTWIKSADKWKDNLPDIALCIVQEGVELPISNQIICRNSKAVFFSLIEHFFARKEEEEPIGKNTVIGSHVQLGRNVRIGHNCSITGDVVIGDDTVISDNVVIKNKVRIGKRCTIQALTMIGEDGFGAYEEENHRKVMIKHYGGVTIGNDVFISSHVDIERGTIDDTYIGDGTKIAPCTLIAHNTRVDKDAVLICSHLYGSVHVGENSWVVGSIVKNQCSVGDNTMIGIGSAVIHDVEAGKVAVGIPARIIREKI